MQDEEKQVSLSVVFVTVGLILVLAAIVIWRALPAKAAQSVQTAVPIINTGEGETAVTPSTSATEGDITLLPETPADIEEYPDHFVSALEAVSPGVGQPTRIAIPTISLDAPITTVGLQAYESDGQTYYQWQVPGNSRAGWHSSSAKLGDSGNTVLNGHHNILGEVFRDLIELNKGDEIILYDLEKGYSYQISDIVILEEQGQTLSVRQENAQWINPTDDERITLITCWPYTDNTHRVVVVAYPIHDDS